MAKEFPPIAGWPIQTSFIHEEKVREKKGGRYVRGSRRRSLKRKEAPHDV